MGQARFQVTVLPRLHTAAHPAVLLQTQMHPDSEPAPPSLPRPNRQRRSAAASSLFQAPSLSWWCGVPPRPVSCAVLGMAHAPSRSSQSLSRTGIRAAPATRPAPYLVSRRAPYSFSPPIPVSTSIPGKGVGSIPVSTRTEPWQGRDPRLVTG